MFRTGKAYSRVNLLGLYRWGRDTEGSFESFSNVKACTGKKLQPGLRDLRKNRAWATFAGSKCHQLDGLGTKDLDILAFHSPINVAEDWNSAQKKKWFGFTVATDGWMFLRVECCYWGCFACSWCVLQKASFFQLKFMVLFNQMGYYPPFISFLPRTILSRVVTLTSVQAK